MEKENQHIWFPAKKYGWGWGFPCAWQGWAVMLVYAVLVAAATVFIYPADSLLLYFSILFGLSFMLCLVCWWKGEKPAWRWGDKK